MPMNRRQFIAGTGAAGAAALGAAAFGGSADAASAPTPYPGTPEPYYPGTLAQQAAASAASNADIGAALRGMGVDHVVVAMMENRSFDHLLSWLPGADGRSDMAYPRAADGNVYPNYPLGSASADPDYQGCGYSDQDHSWEGWLVEDDGGALDGYLNPPGIAGLATKAAANTFSIGYYDAADIPTVAALAQHYTVFDRYFCSFAGETYPNRFYQHSGATDRDHNSGGPSDTTSNPTGSTSIPAIWDQLTPIGAAGATTGVTGAYYFKDVPFLALWGDRYAGFYRPFEAPQTSYDFAPFDTGDEKIDDDIANQAIRGTAVSPSALSGTSFVDAVTSGQLPNVSYIDPSFVVEGSGTSGDWHPLCDVRVGDAFIADVYNLLASNGPDGPTTSVVGSWLDTTLLVINFDEWGGFYDHVQPPKVTDVTDPNLVSHTDDETTEGEMVPDYTQCGFRVPCILVSNLVPAQVVGSGTDPAPESGDEPEYSNHFDHSSVLTLIESIFGLTPVVPYSATATPPAGAVGPGSRDNFSNNLGSVVAANPMQPRTDSPPVPTSVELAAEGRPISGDQVPCSAPTAATSVSPAPIGTTATWTAGYGPATQPGVVGTSPSPSPSLPEAPVAVGAPLAAAALAGAAVVRHRRHRDGSVGAPVDGSADTTDSGD